MKTLLFWLGLITCGIGLILSIYLTYFELIDQVLTTRQKIKNYWPCYAFILIGYTSILIAKWLKEGKETVQNDEQDTRMED